MTLDERKPRCTLRKLRKDARKFFLKVDSVNSFLHSLRKRESKQVSPSAKRRQRKKKLQKAITTEKKLQQKTLTCSNTEDKMKKKIKNLSRNLIICQQQDYQKAVHDIDRQQYSTQSELVDLALQILSKTSPNNVLLYGRKKVVCNSSNMPLLQSATASTIIKHLKSIPWQQLLAEVGDELMLYWLTKCTLLLPVGKNRCLVQLCGDPLGGSNVLPERKEKSRTTQVPSTIDNSSLLALYPEMLQYRWNTQSIMYKGRHSHLKMNAASPELLPSLRPNVKGARALYQNIFRKLSLSMEESSSCNPWKYLFFLGKKRISRRDRCILPLLLEMIHRAKCCKIIPLLKRCCPLSKGRVKSNLTIYRETYKRKREQSQSPSKKKPRLDNTKHLESSESTSNSNTIMHNSKHGTNGIQEEYKGPADNNSDIFAHLVRFHCRPKRVTRFLVAVCSSILPRKTWGSKQNRHKFYRWLGNLVRLRKDDEISLWKLAISMDLDSISWITPAPVSYNPSYIRYRIHRVVLFLDWIVSSIVEPVLTFCFHSTDAEMFRKRLLHYRLDTWQYIEKLFGSFLATSETFRSLSVHQLINEQVMQKGVTFSQLRLIPKNSGLRKIQVHSNMPKLLHNLRTESWLAKEAFYEFNSQYNSMLANIQAVMEYERRRNASIFASCVLSLDEIYRSWLAFKKDWQFKGKPSIYMATVDISNAFDTIRIALLTEKILPELFQEEEYVILRYCARFRSKQGAKPILTRYERIVSDDPKEESHFLLLCRNKIASRFRKAVITDQNSTPSEHNLIHIERPIGEQCHTFPKQFVFAEGRYSTRDDLVIENGFSILWSFERFYLKPQIYSGDGSYKEESQVELSLRLVDDFLYVSSNEKLVLKFSDLMKDGSSLYGVQVNPSKTRLCLDKKSSLFRSQTLQPHSFQSRVLPWCGLLLHRHTLEITVDYSRYFETSLYDTLTFKDSETPIEILKLRSEQVTLALAPSRMFAQLFQFHALLVDVNINRPRTIILNIYQACLLFATKFFGQVFLFHRKGSTFNSEDILSLILENCCPNMVRLVRTRATCEVARSLGCRFHFPWYFIGDLCLFAFQDVCVRLLRRKNRQREFLSTIFRQLKELFLEAEPRLQTYISDFSYLYDNASVLWKLVDRL
eukprot:jgi/Galph1/5001/GphlegSOOS_G3673.1